MHQMRSSQRPGFPLQTKIVGQKGATSCTNQLDEELDFLEF